eukprot:jgi/Mesvir1/13039/Mv06030-RA.1
METLLRSSAPWRMHQVCRIATFASMCMLLVSTRGAAWTSQVGSNCVGDPDDYLVLDFATIVPPEGVSEQTMAVVDMLHDEILAHTGVKLKVSTEIDARVPIIMIRSDSTHLHPEGYEVDVVFDDHPQGAVLIRGRSVRSKLFGVGHFLRQLRKSPNLIPCTRGRVAIHKEFDVSLAPRYLMRGHMIGYRRISNSYDGWEQGQMEQYIREMAIFGTNMVEITGPGLHPDSHMPVEQMKMCHDISWIAHKYDLEFAMWCTQSNMRHGCHPDLFISTLPRLDHLFIPGGDPGERPPVEYLDYVEERIIGVRKYFPNVKVWVSAQEFSREELDLFYKLLHEGKGSDWIYGVVYGPHTRDTLLEHRNRVPSRYPMRHYPDITHTLKDEIVQFRWNYAMAFSHGREPINPRPYQERQVFLTMEERTTGFSSYSEGVNDDFNKMTWSMLGWDPATEVEEIADAYGYFVRDEMRADFIKGWLGLAKNWESPLETNMHVDETLATWQKFENHGAPHEIEGNWRIQQGLYRSYFDAHIKTRLLHEQREEEEVMAVLTRKGVPAERALKDANRMVRSPVKDRVATLYRDKAFFYGDMLHKSIKMKLSVERHGAFAIARGADLDTIDVPLNNAVWLKDRIRDCLLVPESRMRECVDEFTSWADPGPGGFFDDLGDIRKQPHLMGGVGWKLDPLVYHTPHLGFQQPFAPLTEHHSYHRYRLSWSYWAETLYDDPLKMHYEGLDPRGRYTIMAVYTGNAHKAFGVDIKIRMQAYMGPHEPPVLIHDYISKQPISERTFDIPPHAILPGGNLTIMFNIQPGLKGVGRGCQVAEVKIKRVG